MGPNEINLSTIECNNYNRYHRNATLNRLQPLLQTHGQYFAHRSLVCNKYAIVNAYTFTKCFYIKDLNNKMYFLPDQI